MLIYGNVFSYIDIIKNSSKTEAKTNKYSGFNNCLIQIWLLEVLPFHSHVQYVLCVICTFFLSHKKSPWRRICNWRPFGSHSRECWPFLHFLVCLSDLLPTAHRPHCCISSLFRKLWSPGKWFLIRNENAKLQFTLSPTFLSDPIPIIGYACH